MRSYKDFVKDDPRYLSKGLQAPNVWAPNKVLWGPTRILWRMILQAPDVW